MCVDHDYCQQETVTSFEEPSERDKTWENGWEINFGRNVRNRRGKSNFIIVKCNGTYLTRSPYFRFLSHHFVGIEEIANEISEIFAALRVLIHSLYLQVKWTVVRYYMSAMGWGLVGVIGATLLLQVCTDLGSNVWLSLWSDDAVLEANNQSHMDSTVRLGVYSGLGLTSSKQEYSLLPTSKAKIRVR